MRIFSRQQEVTEQIGSDSERCLAPNQKVKGSKVPEVPERFGGEPRLWVRNFFFRGRSEACYKPGRPPGWGETPPRFLFVFRKWGGVR